MLISFWKGVSLFPARAGVIPTVLFQHFFPWSIPRTRGGDPNQINLAVGKINYSPHTRG